MEPWLDSLSEDWNSLPRPSPCLPQSTPTTRQVVAASGKKPQTRIPRLKQDRTSDALAKKSSGATPKSSPPKRKRILSERSNSEINISALSSPLAGNSKSTHIQRSSGTSSMGSDASVVHHEIAKHSRSKSSSPPKSKQNATPEWKKWARDPSSQPDLFSPLPLSNIFQKPDTLQRKTNNRLQLLSEVDSMPSSPPPWSPSHRGAQHSLTKRTRAMSSELQILNEQNEQTEEEQENLHLSADYKANEDLLSSTLCTIPSTVAVPKNHYSVNRSNELQLDGSSELASNENMNDDSSATRIARDTKLQHIGCPTTEPSNPELSTVEEGSSLNSGFSPVFISKHNTVDGSVDYAALDFSNPDVVKQLQRLSVNGSATVGGHDRPRTPEVAPITDFVSVERGRYSLDESFRRRPLSASATSSLVPSDSVSQVTFKTNNILDKFPSPSNVIPSARKSSSAGPPLDRARKAQSPGSPLKIFGNHDTFTNNRLLRRMSRLDNFEAQQSAFSNQSQSDLGRSRTSSLDRYENNKRDMNTDHGRPSSETLVSSAAETTVRSPNSNSRQGDERLQQLPGAGLNDSVNGLIPYRNDYDPEALENENAQTQNKRPGSSAFKPPTPKRQRTLNEIETKLATQPVADLVQERHRQMQAMLGKRKDARYDEFQVPIDPDELARRQKLIPRNHNSAQNQVVVQEHTHADDSLLSNQSKFEIVQEHIENYPLPGHISNPEQVRAIAAEVATIRLTQLANLNGDIRKQSVSTQDYLDEAMKIMDMIRSKPRHETGLATVESFLSNGLERLEYEYGNSTPLTLSRPPSRDGPASAWRTRNGHSIDASVMSHLQKYQEAEDESLMIESMTRSLDAMNEMPVADEEMESDPPNMRTIPPLNGSLGSAPAELDEDVPSLPKTQSSNPSSDSTGRTTTSKSRTLPVIPPEKVSHLINGDEAGMRFDSEKGMWVKIKNPSPTRGDDISSSSMTEDDPFGQIPDLSVNEMEENLRVQVCNSVATREVGLGSASHTTTPLLLATLDSISPANRDVSLEAEVRELNLAVLEDASHAQEDFADTMPEDLLSTEPFAALPSDTVRSRKRDTSVFFSSPVVSHWCEAENWSDQQISESSKSEVEEPYFSRDSPQDRHIQKSLTRSMPLEQTEGQISTRESSIGTHRACSLQFTKADELHEMSMIEKRLDGRTVSLTLSVSTPLPSRRALSTRILSSSVGRQHPLSQILSPLSDFTIHQDDARHMKARNLVTDSRQLATTRAGTNTAMSINNLVEKITDAEPTELYWDTMRALSLRKRELESVNLLDDLCPELEDLDLSDNRLTQVAGAPPSVRFLNAQMNCLNSLTTWNHLRNLQYLNVSGNDIDNLDGFGDLIHLRELNAENNRITNLDGILDLDGLLSLKLKGNCLQEVDFETSVLKRLSEVDLSSNEVSHIRGLHWLPELTQLNLSNNSIRCFPTQDDGVRPLHRLQNLSLDNNYLHDLDVSNFPALRILDADSNELSTMTGGSSLKHIHTISLRGQKSKLNVGSFLSHIIDVRHLFLSNNHIPVLPFHSTRLLNLETLEVACTGLQLLPVDFANLCPNLRSVNLNTNALKDVRALHGIQRLSVLLAAGNRLNRLRRTGAVVGSFQELRVLDLRDNPFCVGFYSSQTCGSLIEKTLVDINQSEWRCSMQHVLPDREAQLDEQYLERLDQDTSLRRRVYELLLATGSSACLEKVDGLEFRIEHVLRKDEIWARLTGFGVVEKVGADGQQDGEPGI